MTLKILKEQVKAELWQKFNPEECGHIIDMAEAYSINRNQARTVLESLVKDGVLRVDRGHKNMYYLKKVKNNFNDKKAAS